MKIFISFIIVFNILSANMLKYEESPYLQQHANNPINWYPWSKEAFDKAKLENKPIFLSIGYSTCHWCHVMEEESFENEEFAKFMNANFISIKVDKEEHPQIDRYFQKVYNLLNGKGGGWPLSIFLTPQGKPFFAQTYMPLKSRGNYKGLYDVAVVIDKIWHRYPSRVLRDANKIESLLKNYEKSTNQISTSTKVGKEIAKEFVAMARDRFDNEFGGFGTAPKFPNASTIKTLLHIYILTSDKVAKDIALNTLDSMAKGGIYDQIEGGFFRYSVDRQWSIPHFEKMLYTNAELIEVYSVAYKVTKDPLYKKVVKESISIFDKRYRYRDLYYSASDADSLDKSGKKEEGRYFVYSYKEAFNALKDANIPNPKEILNNLGITVEGNFEYNLNNPSYIAKVPKRALEVLRDLRRDRKYPFVDKKLQTSWNSLMAIALFEASCVDSNFANEGLRVVDAILNNLYINDILYHQKLPDKKPKLKAYFEDYSYLISALIKAYESSYEQKYLKVARDLYNDSKSKFFDGKGWIDSQTKLHNRLDIYDGSYKNSLAVMANNAQKLALLLNSSDYYQDIDIILNSFSKDIKRYPIATPTAVDVLLAREYGYILLHSNRNDIDKLKRALESESNYPYILYVPQKEQEFTACSINSCFLSDKDINSFVDKVIQTINQGL